MANQVWAGLDVGVETTAVCIVAAGGQVIHEATCDTSLESVHRELRPLRRRKFASVALEAATGMNLARGLRSLGYRVELLEQRQLGKFLRLRRNKTDAGDALGIAEAARLGAANVSRVHLKSLECAFLQSRLLIRRHLVRQRVAALNLLGRQLEHYGGRLKKTPFHRLGLNVESEMRKIFGRAQTDLTKELRYLLSYCEALIEYQKTADRELQRVADQNDVCRRFMEIPGVGPLCALSFYAAISDPFRFRRSSDVGPYLGLTPTIKQSGLKSRQGRISKIGNKATRTLLVGSGKSFLRWSKEDSDLRNWAATIERRRGRNKARVALARKLAVIMLVIWKTGEPYRPLCG